MTFFSDRELGDRPRIGESITSGAWGGIRAEILVRVNDGAFGAAYPETCPDKSGPYATDELALWQALHARVPDLEYRPWWNGNGEPPPLLVVMDTIEFCWIAVGKPIRRGWHDYGKHFHLDYDVEAGRKEFCQAINLIFRRNGLAFELAADGRITRLPAPIIREAILSALFATGDAELDQMLETARRKFLDRDENTRREGLEKLWDAFERIKTVGGGANKAAQAEAMLDRMCGPSSPRLREQMQAEAMALRIIGNNLQIRHSETTQERLAWSGHVDYLFHRMFAFLQFAIRTL